MKQTAPRLSLIGRIVERATAFAWPVTIAGLALAAWAILYTGTHFSLSTSENDLISPHLPYRQAENRLSRQFPNLYPPVVAVVEASTPELAEQSAAALTAKLAADPVHFKSVRRPDAGAFWDREGLLFEPTADVQSSMQQLIAAEPFLGPMAADPSLRGLTASLTTALQGVSAGQTQLSALAPAMAALAGALRRVESGQPAVFSWQNLISGPPDPRVLRKIIFVDPKLNYGKLEPGIAATNAIHAAARSLGLAPDNGVVVHLTGDVPMQDDEFGSLSDRALPIAIVAVVAIIAMLWLATRSRRVIIAILLTTITGLAVAAALGLVIFHTFNVISIAFIPLFVGLGIDFGIQLSVRYRSEHTPDVKDRDALIAAGEGMGRPLTLAAFAIAAGFLAFAPTAYIGVSQLGIIAGVGMLVALALNLTLLPALICLLGPRPHEHGPPLAQVSRLDELILGNRRRVLGFAIGAAGVCVALMPLLHFDFNPIHMRDPRSESIATYFDLLRDPNFTPDTLEAVRPNLAAAQALAAQARRLPEVADARTLADFVPPDQPAKLAAIADAQDLLGLTLNPVISSPPPTDAEVVQSLASTAQALRQAAAGNDHASGQARELADAFDRLAKGPPAMRARADAAIMTPFKTTLSQIQSALAAQPVTLDTLPPDIVRDWKTPDGRALVSISPKGDSNNDAVLTRFINAVTKIAPDATGTPLGIREGGRTVVYAFAEAGILSFIAITVLLFLVLRRVRDVAITMAPIVLTGLLTLGSCVVFRTPLNFANIIALPLLFGIGVAFHIYFVMSWRSGGSHLLTSSLARAVFFSALTTATGFGSLWLSRHPGTASMGKLLMISLIWTLVSALIFQPALMGEPREAQETDATA